MGQILTTNFESIKTPNYTMSDCTMQLFNIIKASSDLHTFCIAFSVRVDANFIPTATGRLTGGKGLR